MKPRLATQNLQLSIVQGKSGGGRCIRESCESLVHFPDEDDSATFEGSGSCVGGLSIAPFVAMNASGWEQASGCGRSRYACHDPWIMAGRSTAPPGYSPG